LLEAVTYDPAGIPTRVVEFGGHIRERIHARLHPLEAKRHGEFRYWQDRAAVEGPLGGNHFEWCFTDHFGIGASEYGGKRILNVGCGPRGILEWAHSAATRIGVDPHAHPYLALGAAGHSMMYTSASSDALPFRSDCFDVVSSFNSLDHVDDLAATIHELQRVLRPGGRLLLLAEVNQPATIVEPITLRWHTPELFDSLEIVRVEHYEMVPSGLFDSLRTGRKYDHSNPTPRTGVISAFFTKPR
jgi:SAM-dependent methyltransferase